MKKVKFFLIAAVLLGAASLAMGVEGPQLRNMNTSGRVNKHNFSGDPTRIAPGITYKAAYDSADRRTTEICIFCHTPHNATPSTPLWGRRGTVTSSFGYYTSTTLVIHTDSTANTASGYGEPNYASKLCLSCHDGATALGAVLNGPEITFVGGPTIPARNGEFNVFNPNQGYNDATQHHHPVSFKYNETVRSRINTLESKSYKFPWVADGGGNYLVQEVKLDRNGYMQCTTCHNPHQNMSDADSGSPDASVDTPFWVIKNSQAQNSRNVHDTVCLSCHPSDLATEPDSPNPDKIKNPYPYP